MKKLFTKLDEQKAINSMKANINEEETAKIENEIIFNGFVNKLNESIAEEK